eukprot:CAMPEP_0175139080 /NCGR_PEP_ID=MMETSP0087-20121206/10698_1 /TAXON_ID=136419 /ORGANISM="Unknown Unknown, Strain D1" /LENGTH=822 /DNA_ID=CAMNT_0016422039 /DNA_START=9 /DNA_END=2480 /DNA_ORIENTATION=-
MKHHHFNTSKVLFFDGVSRTPSPPVYYPEADQDMTSPAKPMQELLPADKQNSSKVKVFHRLSQEFNTPDESYSAAGSMTTKKPAKKTFGKSVERLDSLEASVDMSRLSITSPAPRFDTDGVLAAPTPVRLKRAASRDLTDRGSISRSPQRPRYPLPSPQNGGESPVIQRVSRQYSDSNLKPGLLNFDEAETSRGSIEDMQERIRNIIKSSSTPTNRKSSSGSTSSRSPPRSGGKKKAYPKSARKGTRSQTRSPLSGRKMGLAVNVDDEPDEESMFLFKDLNTPTDLSPTFSFLGSISPSHRSSFAGLSRPISPLSVVDVGGGSGSNSSKVPLAILPETHAFSVDTPGSRSPRTSTLVNSLSPRMFGHTRHRTKQHSAPPPTPIPRRLQRQSSLYENKLLVSIREAKATRSSSSPDSACIPSGPAYSTNSSSSSSPNLSPSPSLTPPQLASRSSSFSSEDLPPPPPPPPSFLPPFPSTSRVRIDSHERQGLSLAPLPLSRGVSNSRIFDTEFTQQQLVGEGAFNHVYKCFHVGTQKYFAIKKSKRPFRSKGERAHYLQEVLLVAKLAIHRNVVTYFRAWQEELHFWIQMELCEGSLEQLARDKRFFLDFDRRRVWDVAYQIGCGLHHVHEAGVLHLDIKTANILVNFVDEFPLFKVADFGQAVLKGHFEDGSEGDSQYMAPEVFHNPTVLSSPPMPSSSSASSSPSSSLSSSAAAASSASCGPQSSADVFSLGLVLFELVTERPLPLSGPRWHDLRSGRHSKELQALHNPQIVPSELGQLIQEMLDPDPNRRPSALEITNRSESWRRGMLDLSTLCFRESFSC